MVFLFQDDEQPATIAAGDVAPGEHTPARARASHNRQLPERTKRFVFSPYGAAIRTIYRANGERVCSLERLHLYSGMERAQ